MHYILRSKFNFVCQMSYFFVLIATTSAGRMANERKNVCTERG